MSRFYMTSVNSRGNTVSDAHLRGWRVGIEVEARPKPLDKERDMLDVYLTSGSSGHGSRKLIGTAQETHDGRVIFVPENGETIGLS